MQGKSEPTIRWLTLAAWLSVLMFAVTSTLTSVSLKHIGVDLQIGFDLRGALAPSRSVPLAVATFLVGYLADRLGKRWFLSGGLFIVAVALFWVGQSSTYVALIVGMVLLGMGLGAVEALVSPLVAELHPRSVATHLSVLHAFFPLGLVAFSVPVGLALDSGVHWRTPFGLAAAPALLVGVMFLCGRYPGDGSGRRTAPLRVRAILADRTFWLLAVAMVLTAGSEGTLIIWTPNFLQHEYGVSAQVGAYGLVAFSATMVLGRFGTAAVARVLPLRRMMVALALLTALATLVLAAVADLWVNLVALGFAGLFVACFWPCILSLATSQIAAGSATLLAMLAVAGIAGFGGMPWVIGVVAEHFSLRAGFGLVPVALVAAALVLIALARTPERARPEAEGASWNP